LFVVSPSKRAGDTVEAEVEAPPGTPGGNGHAGEQRPKAVNGTGVKRRSVITNGAAVPPERGTASQRGASSSSITRRSVVGTATPAAPAPSIDEPTDEPADEVSTQLPPPATTEAISARTREVREVEVPDQPLTLPAVTPAAQPAPRESTDWAHPVTVESPPEQPPYATTTMSSHQIAPVPRLVGRRPRVRKVTRVVRHVDPWSVFKVAIVFNLVLYVVLLTAGVLLWNVAYATGTIDNLERFFESFGWSEFEFDGGAIYHSAWIAGLFGVIGLTGVAVLGATLFNLITDLVGGVRLTVLEEEVVERTASPMRRFVVRRPTSDAFDPGSEIRREADRLPVVQDGEAAEPSTESTVGRSDHRR
jgi:hypothetical protein